MRQRLVGKLNRIGKGEYKKEIKIDEKKENKDNTDKNAQLLIALSSLTRSTKKEL